MVKLPHWPIPYDLLPASESLNRMERLLKNMGNPHHFLPPTIHVAGTNGKGSTIAFMRYILQSAGYRVHAYTSPHIIRYNERIKIAGNEISDEYLNEIIEVARVAAGDMKVTFWEGTTAAAFYAFAKVKADILLLETGMGGRLDATNVIDDPALTVITPISYDHMEYLGSTLEEIAYQKAGIIKPRVPLIIGPQSKEASQALLSVAHYKNAPCFAYNDHWRCLIKEKSFSFIADNEEVEFPLPFLKGYHQCFNASLAIASLQCLPEFNFRYQDIIQGLQSARWPARLQKLEQGSIVADLKEGWSIWVDGAHNIEGARVLSKNLDLWKDSKVVLINGRTKGRDIAGFLKQFLYKVDNLIAVRVKSEPNPEDPQNIIKCANELGFKNTYLFEDVKDAIRFFINNEDHPKITFLICGSLYLWADIIKEG